MNESADVNIIQSPLNKAVVDRYYFIMKLPDCMQKKSSAWVLAQQEKGFDKNTVGWSIKTSNVPSDNIKSQDIGYGGASMTVSSHTKSQYNPLKIEFRIDNRYGNYMVVKEWMDLIQDDMEGYFDSNNIADGDKLGDYATDVTIVALDEFNNPVISWRYTHCFPTDISELSLDYTKSEEIDMTVEFKFSQKKVTYLQK